MQIPPESPALSSIEMFWSQVRKQLRLQDLHDLKQKRQSLDRKGYVDRGRALLRSLRSRAAQRAAKRWSKRVRSVCTEVVKRNGAAASN